MADTGGGSERGAVERDGSAAPRPNPRELFAQRRAATMSSLPSQFSSAKPGGNGLRLGDEAIYPEVSALNLRSQSRTLQRRRSTSVYSTNPHDILTSRVVLAMVGLPARGKSYLSKAIFRYLNFLGCPTKLFNAGNLRRQAGLAGTAAARDVDAVGRDADDVIHGALAHRHDARVRLTDRQLRHRGGRADADCSCPQAARRSRPRGGLTGEA